MFLNPLMFQKTKMFKVVKNKTIKRLRQLRHIQLNVPSFINISRLNV